MVSSSGSWRYFCDGPRLSSFSFSVPELIDFLSARFEAGCHAATLTNAASAIAHGHRIAGLPDPSVAFPIQRLLAGARRLRASQDKRLALSLTDVDRPCHALGSLPISPIERAAFRAIITLSFFAKLRPEEVVLGVNPVPVLRSRQVTLGPHQLAITIPCSKTSTMPFAVHLAARPDLSLCPVVAMRNYLALRGTGPPDDMLFINGRQRPSLARTLHLSAAI